MKSFMPAVFMHIMKTAGTTIVDLARSAYGNHDLISHGDYLEGVNHYPFKWDFRVNEQGFHDFQRASFCLAILAMALRSSICTIGIHLPFCGILL